VCQSESYKLEEEDKKTVVSLYKKCPDLWEDFRHVMDCMDAFQTRPVNYESVSRKLEKLKAFPGWKKDAAVVKQMGDFCHFVAASGFVELAVSFYRSTLAALNLSYLTQIKYHTGYPSHKHICLYVIRDRFLSYSAMYTSEIPRRLLKAGFVNDMTKDLKHAQHLSGEALVSTTLSCI
jgi:hypothetical protein